ncbi:MAG: right-handed parallel beta-helix repeat-containing protein [Pseudohaliea sp.]
MSGQTGCCLCWWQAGSIRLAAALFLGLFFSGVLRADERIVVSTAEELLAAVKAGNETGGVTVALRDGVYELDRVLNISGDRVVLESVSQGPSGAILRGRGMRQGAGNLVVVSGKWVRLSGLTLERAGNHLVQLRGEADADFFKMTNCVLRDGWEQLFKVSKVEGEDVSADFGELHNNMFAYSARFGPQYYIGGLDMHGGRGWVISENAFRNIASPAGRVAEHAIHLWKGSADNTVKNNLIINSDRGIGFGLTADPANGNNGGAILGNVILHTRRDDPFSDVGIALESSPGTLVANNVIELAHSYPHAIEYRFETTRGVKIVGNRTNKAIVGLDGGRAALQSNTSGSLWRRAIDILRTSWRGY